MEFIHIWDDIMDKGQRMGSYDTCYWLLLSLPAKRASTSLHCVVDVICGWLQSGLLSAVFLWDKLSRFGIYIPSTDTPSWVIYSGLLDIQQYIAFRESCLWREIYFPLPGQISHIQDVWDYLLGSLLPLDWEVKLNDIRLKLSQNLPEIQASEQKQNPPSEACEAFTYIHECKTMVVLLYSRYKVKGLYTDYYHAFRQWLQYMLLHTGNDAKGSVSSICLELYYAHWDGRWDNVLGVGLGWWELLFECIYEVYISIMDGHNVT